MGEQSFELRHRDYGRISKHLIEFYAHCKAGESIVFLMPEGKIYSQAAHNADKQAYALGVLEGLKDDLRALPRHRPTNTSLWDGVQMNVALEKLDQAIAKVKQDLGREV